MRWLPAAARKARPASPPCNGAPHAAALQRGAPRRRPAEYGVVRSPEVEAVLRAIDRGHFTESPEARTLRGTGAQPPAPAPAPAPAQHRLLPHPHACPALSRRSLRTLMLPRALATPPPSPHPICMLMPWSCCATTSAPAPRPWTWAAAPGEAPSGVCRRGWRPACTACTAAALPATSPRLLAMRGLHPFLLFGLPTAT